MVVEPAPFDPIVIALLLSEPESSTPGLPIVLPEMVPFIDAPASEPGSRLMLMASSKACWMLLLLTWKTMSSAPLVLMVMPPPRTFGSLPAVVFSTLSLNVMFIVPVALASVAAWK